MNSPKIIRYYETNLVLIWIKCAFKKLFIYFSFLIPLPKSHHKIFTTFFSHQDAGGPGRFMLNLRSTLNKNNIRISKFFPSNCFSALIISNSPGNFFFSLCKRKKIKTVIRVDGFYPPSLMNSKSPEDINLSLSKIAVNQRLQKDLILSDWVIYQSLFCKQMSDTYLYSRADRYSIIYNGVDTEHFRPLNPSPSEIPQLLLLGTWRDPALMHINLEVFWKVYQQKHCRLKLVGPMTQEVFQTYNDWLRLHEHCVNEIDTLSSVSFYGLPQIIRSCSLSLHLKSGDWCPNAVLETLSCGVPVVCHSNGGTKEIVGNAGFAIDGDESEKHFIQNSASKTIEVLQNLEPYKQRARERVLQFFTLEIMAQKYLEVLSSPIS